MTAEELALAVVDALEAVGLPYMLVGSFSSNYYGVARSTRDADFVLQLEGKPLRDLMAHLGPAFRLDPQVTFETVTGTTRHTIRVPDSQFEIELFHLSEDAHDQSRFQRRRRVQLRGHPAYVPTAEDVIVTKLRWYVLQNRPKDREDVRDVLAVQTAERIDWEYVHHWCGLHGSREALDEIRRSVPVV